MKPALLSLAPALMVLAAPVAMAEDAPSPASQVYQMGSLGGDEGYRVSFDADGSFHVGFNGLHPPFAQGDEGQWMMDPDGAVTLTGEDLPLLAPGTDSARCERWPALEVGDYYDQLPCWWTGDEPDGWFGRTE